VAENRDRVVRIPYTSVRNGHRFYEPRGRMRKYGFHPRALGPDNEPARRIAWGLLEQWKKVRAAIGKPDAPPQTRETACMAKYYPPGSTGSAWQEWIQTRAWAALASSTRNKIWWEAWNKRIEPIFGDVAPDTITMKMVDDWRADMEEISGIDAAHKALKVFRAFWRVMLALRYAQLSDPSQKIVNKAPKGRSARFDHGEAVRLAKGAWRAGYRGLACIIMVAWDTGFAPQDARTLRVRHKNVDSKTRRIFFDCTADGRGKTGVAVIGTLSRFSEYLVGRYLAELGAEHTADSFLFRMRSGVPYGQSRLGNDFAKVREMVMSSDKRQLRDMRRSAVVEIFTGGGDAEDVAEKIGNTISHSNTLFRIYNPVDLEKVRQADAARIEGRRRKNKG
jgi:hypothetical protein